jgi:hypothetical protein
MSLALARSLVITLGFIVAFIAPLYAGPVRYDAGNGLTASADFRVSGRSLRVLLTNTSVAPFGGQDGTANMVLRSISFNLPAGVTILGGSVALGPGSSVVTSTSGNTWLRLAGLIDLDQQFGFSNAGPSTTARGTTVGVTSAVTSYRNGDRHVVAFGGGTLAGNGLEWGLVPKGSLDLDGTKMFVQNSVLVTLRLSAPVADTSFLTSRSYVEFGSDYAHVPAGGMIPEPALLALVDTCMMLGARLQKRRRQE